MAKAYKVLVVDDDKAIRDTFKRILNGDKYETFEAQNGMQALELLKKQRIDICFLDIRMPGMDGIATFKTLKALELDFPIIIMTGQPFEDKIKEALNSGAADYLYKPFDIIEIHSTINKLKKKKELS